MAKKAIIAERLTERSTPRYMELIEIATKLFARDGYDRTSVRSISDEMGIESGSLYSHISSKEDLLFDIIIDCVDEWFDRAEKARNQAEGSEEALRALAHAHMTMLHDRREACDIYYDEWRKLNSARQRKVTDLRSQYVDLFNDVVQEGMGDGTFDSRLDLSWATLVIMSALNWTFEWYKPDGSLAPEAVGDHLLDVILPGLLHR